VLLQGWRLCYYGTGTFGLIITLLTTFTLREPERQAIGEESDANAKASVVSGEEKPASKSGQWRVMLQPRVIMLCLAASIRHTGKCYAGMLHSSPHFYCNTCQPADMLKLQTHLKLLPSKELKSGLVM